MIATQKPLLHLTAVDVMSQQVISVPQTMMLQDAAHLLAREQISGAPVVDGAGHCVGILSATDFVRWAEREPEAPTNSKTGFCADWEMVDQLPQDEVAQHMSTDLVTADPDTPIAELARRMLDAHIHRIVVLNERRQPVGLISSTDILAAVAYAPEAECAPPN